MARLGAKVRGIDASRENIEVARAHAQQDAARLELEYEQALLAEVLARGERFEAVTCLEVLEHVPAPDELVGELCTALEPGGRLALSTITRSTRALAEAILAAEYLLRLVPRGTHDWSRFLRPEELVALLRRHSMQIESLVGFRYSPLANRWHLVDIDSAVNYGIIARKPPLS